MRDGVEGFDGVCWKARLRGTGEPWEVCAQRRVRVNPECRGLSGVPWGMERGQEKVSMGVLGERRRPEWGPGHRDGEERMKGGRG